MSTNSIHPKISASAPATLMLTGEHAVLHGYPALVTALDQRLTVTLTPRKDKNFSIKSQEFKEYSGNINDISNTKPFPFILTAIKQYQSELATGFDLTIQSDFSHQVGLGSSAAVTVATLKVLSKWLGNPLSQDDLFKKSYTIIKEVQKVGSGADVAACVWGGIQFYQQDPFLHTTLSSSFPISVVYTGSKKPTVEVIALVEKNAQQAPEEYEDYFRILGEYTLNAQHLIEKKNWEKLGDIFNCHYEIQKLMELSTPEIDNFIQKMRAAPGIYGAKISGSGLGDCIIGVGTSDQNLESQLHVKIDPCGAIYE